MTERSTDFPWTNEQEATREANPLEEIPFGACIIDGHGEVWVKSREVFGPPFWWVRLTGKAPYSHAISAAIPLPARELQASEIENWLSADDLAMMREIFDYNRSHATAGETTGDAEERGDDRLSAIEHSRETTEVS